MYGKRKEVETVQLIFQLIIVMSISTTCVDIQDKRQSYDTEKSFSKNKGNANNKQKKKRKGNLKVLYSLSEEMNKQQKISIKSNQQKS